MITDQPRASTPENKNGTHGTDKRAANASSARTAGDATLTSDEVGVPPFLERRYNLDVLKQESAWPWEAIDAIGTRVYEPYAAEEAQAPSIKRTPAPLSVAPIAPVGVAPAPAVGGIAVRRGWRRDAAMLAVGAVLGAVIIGVLTAVGLFGGSNRTVNGGIAGIPTATVPAVVAATETPAAVEPTLVIVVPPTDTVAVVRPTDTVEPTATATEVVAPSETPSPTDTPEREVEPTRAPARPTNTRVILPAPTATEIIIVPTHTPVIEEPTATPTGEVVPTEEEATSTPEPGIEPTVEPIGTPIPLPGIITPTPVPVDTIEPTNEPIGTPTPLPGILTPTPGV